ncbi:FecCD family ABC transporter permease [Lysinibacillus sp. NPDC047702]|uniref:FecCD family ABC transporter permease n=1 Tax=unclassified Lysinibacillus TaxID=2636778 RepID=UPI003CFC972A
MNKKFILLSLTLLLVLIISMTLAVMVGSVSITPLYVWQVILSKIPIVQNFIEQDWSRSQEIIIWQIRVPRVLLAAIVGAGLAIAGAAIQALVRNSIAEPYILGISSGATVGATAVIILGAFSFLGIFALSASAFLGSLLAILLVFFLARVGGRISVFRLLLAGMAVSFILSAVSNFILMMAKQENGIKAVMYWMLGSLAGAKWSNIIIPTAIFIVVFALLWLHYRNLNLLLLGEEAAVTLGVNIQQFRLQLILLVSLLTGVLVAVSGSIGFVGLIIPHIVRIIVGSNYKYVIPISALLGGIFLVWADAIARILIAPEEMPIGIITAFCGGPFFIWLLRRNNYSFGEGD